jgi:hypothetical protein
MLFTYEKIGTVKCKVSKYIRFPKIAIRNINSPLLHDIQKTYNLIIHKTYNRYHATLYYIKNKVIHFYKTYTTTLRDIIVLHNYKNRQTYFIKPGFNYDSKNVAKYKYNCVKAPNGNVYLVYVRWMSGTKKQLIVYNITNNHILHKVVYDWSSDIESNLENEDVERYSHFIGNSFVLIYKAVEDGFFIHIVDLVSETVDKFHYTIKDYLKVISSAVESQTDRKIIKSLYSPNLNPALYAVNKPLWEINKVERVIANSESDVLYIKELRLHFTISSKRVLSQISDALIVYFAYETDALDIKVITGTNVIIEIDTQPAVRIQVPSNVILINKRYKIKGAYDVSKSHPYYILRVSENYLITQYNVFELSPYKTNSYILEHVGSYLSNSENLYDKSLYNLKGVNIIRINNSFLADLRSINPNQRINFGLDIITEDYLGAMVELVDLKNIYDLAQENHNDMFVDISNLITKIIIIDKVKNILNIRCKLLGIKENKHIHFYNLDRKKQVLYIFIMVRRNDINYDYVYLWIYECNVRRWESDCRLVADLEIGDERFSIKKGIISLLAKNIFFHHIVSHLKRFEKFYYNTPKSLYIHNNEVMVMNQNKHLKIIDIIQNRANTLKYPSRIPEGIGVSAVYHVFNDNILLFKNEVTKKDNDRFEFYYPLIFSDLTLVKPITIKRPRYR